MSAHDSTIGGCTRPMLIADATAAGKRWRNAIKRGDITVGTAFHESGVGYPYMTSAESAAACAAFVLATK